MTMHRIRNLGLLGLMALSLSLSLALPAGAAQAARHAVAGKTVTLDLGHTLDQRKMLDPADFTVTAAGTAVAVLSASFAKTGTGVALGLARAPAAGAAVTVTYAWPWSGEGLWTASGDQIDRFTLSLRAGGTAADPAALSASFHGLPAAHDGKKRFGFELRFGEEVPGLTLTAVKAALTVTGGRTIDVRRTVRGSNGSVTVRVRPAGAGALTLALKATADCAATGAICARGGKKLASLSATVPGPAGNAPATPESSALTASFVGLPAEHDGSERFGFEIRFSDEVAGPALRAVAAALRASGGKVVAVKRTAAGQSRNFTVQVQPDGTDDVTVSLPATADCAATGAICASGGRKLAALTATVPGPAGLSVADARADEGPDAAVAFTVTLSRAAAGTVTVDYATADGTATAGRDYTQTGGTLSFAAGETEKTVSVPLLDDAHDEGEETFALNLSNPSGAVIADGEATGTIVNSDPLQKIWLARFGRTVAIQTVEALEGRFAVRAGAAPRMTVTMMGRTLDLAQTGEGQILTAALTGLARAFGATPPNNAANGNDPFGNDRFARHDIGARTGTGARGLAPARRPTMRELLPGSAFHFTTGEMPGLGGAMTSWGKVLSDTSGGSGGSGSLSFAGETATGVLGVDWEGDWLLAGVALSRTVESGGAAFAPSGTDYGIEGTLTMVTPYLRVRAGEGLSFWSALGSGGGAMTLSWDGVSQTADIAMRLAAAGGRAELLRPGPDGGLALALKADAFFVRTRSARVSTPGVGNLAAATGDASRVRAVLEGSRAFALPDGGALEPSLSL
ncbi:MAG: SwmB domain-containing protein, partial [Rhodospirillaceae bacterium]|nr:SwmB domain-containing protein [Rhodospirillaceae bacterium]MDE0616032.1 SwmB domain-containing protein [Rhodospirillaceae bacterium]